MKKTGRLTKTKRKTIENMDLITLAVIEPDQKQSKRNRITVLTASGREEVICGYYTDELKFSEKEFLGLTLIQAGTLFLERDKAQLVADIPTGR